MKLEECNKLLTSLSNSKSQWVAPIDMIKIIPIKEKLENIILKLSEEKYIETSNHFDIGRKINGNFYRITNCGKLFIQNGGYKKDAFWQKDNYANIKVLIATILGILGLVLTMLSQWKNIITTLGL